MNLKNTDTQIVATGVSRTDVFYDKAFIENAKETVYSVFPQARTKKILLYAPTFRGRVAKAEAPDRLDIRAMKEALGDEYVLLLKHHPFVKKLPGSSGGLPELRHGRYKSSGHRQTALCQ